MKKKIIILAAIFAQIIQTSCNQKSEDDTNYLEIFQDVKSEAESLVLINDLIEKDEIIGLQCLHHTIHKGWFNASSTLIAKYYNPKQRDLYEEFVKIRKKLKLENIQIFSNLTNLLPDQSPSLVKAEPCYMWAQNMTHIFMKIKFSPKIDVPGYLEMHRLNVSITLPELTVSAVAFTGDFPVLFYLNIKTYKFMNAHHSKWYQTEMGTITMEILKSPSPYVWRNIHAELHHNPHNQYIWWEIYRLYQDQFEAGFSLLADTEMKRDEKEDQYHLREERMISDKRLIREKLAEQKAIQNQITRDKMYCTEMRNKKRNYIADPFEWEAWQV